MHHPQPGIAELATLDADVVAALKAHDETRLTVIGKGEITIALGWPAENPQYVCKRTPPFSPDDFHQYQSLVHEYVDKVRATGQAVVDTHVIGIEHGDDIVGYVVQPMLDVATLGENVLAATVAAGEEPSADHPLLVAVADATARTTSTCSIDAQVTNFSWDGEQLTLVDVGTPFLWTESGELRFDLRPFSGMLPAPVRALAIRELTKVIDRWNDPRTVAVDVVSNLLREGLNAWTEPMLTALNYRLELTEPITLAEARESYEEDRKIFPTLVKLQGVERWWREKVRKQTYQWFIWSTYD